MKTKIAVNESSQPLRSGQRYTPSRPLGLIFFATFIGLAVLMGGDVAVFVNVPAIVVCGGGTVALSLMAFGLKDLQHATLHLASALSFREVPREDTTSRDVQIVRTMIVYLHACGLIGFVIGNIQILNAFDEIGMLYPAMATSLLCPLYSLLIGEGLLRPTAHRLEQTTLARQES